MSKKYIRQEIIQNFVYPNNEVSQYDIDIVQNINDNSVDGTVNSFSATTVNATGITINYNITWNLNGAEPWIRNSNLLGFVSVHMLAPGQDYYKPWRLVSSLASATTNLTTFTGTQIATITPSQVGLTTFTDGTYYFEVRFIGHLSIYPVCVNLDLTMVTPTPTPTATPTPTPTVTPTTANCLTTQYLDFSGFTGSPPYVSDGSYDVLNGYTGGSLNYGYVNTSTGLFQPNVIAPNGNKYKVYGFYDGSFFYYNWIRSFAGSTDTGWTIVRASGGYFINGFGSYEAYGGRFEGAELTDGTYHYLPSGTYSNVNLTGTSVTISCTSLPIPTPTPTPTATPTPSGGGKSLEIYGRDIDGTPATLTFFYSKNGGGAINVPGYVGAPLPSSCTFLYTITGLTEFDSIEFGTSIACVMNGNGSSSTCPSSSGSSTTYTYVIDAPSIQQVAITIDSGTIP